METYVKECLNLTSISMASRLKLLQAAQPIPRISSEINVSDLNSLKRAIEQRNICEGDLIKINGYFSNFGQTYFPLTYMPTIPDSATLEQEEPRYVSTSNGITIPQIKGKMQWRIKCFQLPVENIPYVRVENRNWKIGFLYSNKFNGFIFDEDPSTDKKTYRLPCLRIPDHACPLIVVFDPDTFMEFTESNIEMTAQVIFLERDILEGFGCCLENLRPVLHKHCFVNMGNTLRGICLSLTRHTGSVKTLEKRSVKGNLVVEAFFEGTELLPNFSKVFSDSVPNVLMAPIRSMTYLPYTEHSAFIPTTGLNFLFRSPSTFSLLSDSCLTDTEIDKTLNLVRKHYFSLIRNINGMTSKQNAIPTVRLLYIPDASQQTLFGIVNSMNLIHRI